jgi:hypothetical protein
MYDFQRIIAAFCVGFLGFLMLLPASGKLMFLCFLPLLNANFVIVANWNWNECSQNSRYLD